MYRYNTIYCEKQLRWVQKHADRIYYTQQEIRAYPQEQLLVEGHVNFGQYQSFQRYFNYWSADYLDSRVNKPNIPIHMLGSDSDPFIPKEVYERNADVLRNMTSGPVELTIFSGWGHEPTHPRNVEEFTAWIKTAMDQIISNAKYAKR